MKYTVVGTAAGDQTWTCEGTVTTTFPDCLEDAMRAAFQQLTQGKAVFGNPGVGCRGPYKITRFEIIQSEQ